MARRSGTSANKETSDNTFRTVREGKHVTVFTVGYEKRDGDELISILRNAGVEVLADVREKPMSRKPDFRGAALRALCEEAGIAYEGWPRLGSTEAQRTKLQETEDFQSFEREFRKYAIKLLGDDLDGLAKRAKAKSIALLCYERNHEECHRSVVADLLADRLNASIVAL